MARHPRTLKVYARLLRRDIARSARRLVVVHRRKKGQVTITLNRPGFKTSQNYFRKWRTTRSASANQTSAMIGSIGLLVLGFAGISAALVQLGGMQSSPVNMVRQVEAKSEAPVAPGPAVLPRSVPTRLSVTDIAVDTSLIQLGQNADGTLEVPEGYDVAGWYRDSPTPGEIGPSVIVGHVDNYEGAAVFYRLKELQAGQKISITREDGSIADFAVTQVAQFDQDNFPTDAVYGNIDHAGLRLITCGGAFDHINQRYTQNTVVYARLITPEAV